MKKVNDGGPAFPSRLENHGLEPMQGFLGDVVLSGKFTQYSGVSIRQFYAAKAMQALIPLHHEMELSFAITAEDSLRMADAMIAAESTSADAQQQGEVDV